MADYRKIYIEKTRWKRIKENTHKQKILYVVEFTYKYIQRHLLKRCAPHNPRYMYHHSDSTGGGGGGVYIKQI